MLYFAKIKDGLVVDCRTIRDEDIGGLAFPESEQAGKELLASVGLEGEWVQTSKTGEFNGRYAGIGMNWDGICFHGDSPFPSWELNQTTGTWQPPVDYPGEGYMWDEDTVSWVAIP